MAAVLGGFAKSTKNHVEVGCCQPSAWVQLLISSTFGCEENNQIEKALKGQQNIGHDHHGGPLLSKVNNETGHYPTQVHAKGIEDHGSSDASGFFSVR